ncbi:hypothetical protein HZB06_02195 [Candidatus Wolfebacteria bacterium]|nr:hypothetical protein [Candidatus Wolfebacteria bacterium]
MIVILHNIRSLYNVGSVFRTADAAGVEKIYLCGITPAPVDAFGRPRQQLTKVSLGAEKYVEWEHFQSAARLIDRLKNPARQSFDNSRRLAGGDGYKIFAIEQSKNSVPYYSVKIKSAMTRHSDKKIALVLGSEVRDLPASILKRADKILEIPMKGAMIRQARHPRRTGRGKESLNVSVAFGIVVFHIISRHKTTRI